MFCVLDRYLHVHELFWKLILTVVCDVHNVRNTHLYQLVLECTLCALLGPHEQPGQDLRDAFGATAKVEGEGEGQAPPHPLVYGHVVLVRVPAVSE